MIRVNLDDDYFDTMLIYQLTKLNIEILDVPIKARYENEKSNINVLTTGLLMLLKNFAFLFGIKKINNLTNLVAGGRI